jgi:hypothetical protein
LAACLKRRTETTKAKFISMPTKRMHHQHPQQEEIMEDVTALRGLLEAAERGGSSSQNKWSLRILESLEKNILLNLNKNNYYPSSLGADGTAAPTSVTDENDAHHESDTNRDDDILLDPDFYFYHQDDDQEEEQQQKQTRKRGCSHEKSL